MGVPHRSPKPWESTGSKIQTKASLFSKHFLPEMDESTPQKTNMTLEKNQFSIGKKHKKTNRLIHSWWIFRPPDLREFSGRSIKSDPQNLRSRMYKPEDRNHRSSSSGFKMRGFWCFWLDPGPIDRCKWGEIMDSIDDRKINAWLALGWKTLLIWSYKPIYNW